MVCLPGIDFFSDLTISAVDAPKVTQIAISEW